MLSLIIPTRNRPTAVQRLLQSLRDQTLPADRFEVIVVDDGSDPPIELNSKALGVDFSIQVLRRTENHGAAASRWAGLKLATGDRIAFLDDDVIPEPGTLEAHLVAGDREITMALGPVLYPLTSQDTPYLRSMARCYAAFERAVRRRQGKLLPGDFWFCSSSATTAIWQTVFEAADRTNQGVLEGGGSDETLIGIELVRLGIEPTFLPTALAWHYDDKTLAIARREFQNAGAAECRLVQRNPWARAYSGLFKGVTGSSRKAAIRRAVLPLFWAAPGPWRGLADFLALLAERGPSRITSQWFCYLSLRIAFWEGVRKTAPRYSQLWVDLRPIEA